MIYDMVRKLPIKGGSGFHSNEQYGPITHGSKKIVEKSVQLGVWVMRGCGVA